MNTSSIDWREELRAQYIHSVANQNVEPENNCSESEDNEEDAMEIESKSAVNSGEALAMLDKLQVFFEENDADNEVLQSVTSLRNKVWEQWEYNLRNKKYYWFFQVTFFVGINVNLSKSIVREKSTI